MLIAAMVASLQLGSYPVSPSTILAVLMDHGTPQEEMVLLGMRLTRLAVVVFAGLALSLSGATLQVISRRPWAGDGRKL